MMDTLTRDLRFALRQLARSPGFTLLGILMLALGVGATATIFTVVNTLFLKPPAHVGSPERLVAVYTSDYSGPRFGYSAYQDYLDFRAAGDVFAGLAAYSHRPVGLATGRASLRVFGEAVSRDYFTVLQVSPVLGRTFGADDSPVSQVVLGYGLWQREFGGALDVVGRSVRVAGQPFTVIGVAPRGFAGSMRGVDIQLWIPLAAEPLLNPGSDDLTNRGSRGLLLTGRLTPGATVQTAQARLDLVAKQLHQAYPRQWTDRTGASRVITVIPEREARVFPEFRGAASGFLSVLMGVAALVLLICCANLANLMLARGASRRRELAVRLALGSTRAGLVRQLLTEALLLSIAGGALGVLLASWAADLLTGVRPPLPVPFLLDLTIDARVLGFGLAVTLLTTVGFALLPAWRASGLGHSAVLRAQGAAPERHRRLGLRDALVVAQVAVSLVVLVAAGLFLGSLRNASQVDLGFQPDRVVMIPLELGIQGYDESRGREFYAELERRVQALPRVQAASFAEIVPLGLARQRRGVQVEGYQPQEGEEMEFGVNTVGPEYFRTLGIPLVRGRAFDQRDRPGGPPVAVINEAFAGRFWPGADPIGRRISTGRRESIEVIGVARDSKYASLGEEPQPHFYEPLLQVYEDRMVLLVRTTSDPADMFAGLRREVQALDPDLPLELSTLEEHLGFAVLPQRLGAWVLGAFGLTGLILATLGLYGVLSYVVSQRTPELGIRRALGATQTDVYRLVVQRGMALTVLGLGVGLVGSVAVTRLVSSFLVGMSPTDPIVLTGVLLSFALVALVASLLPARRAASVDPMIALRSE